MFKKISIFIVLMTFLIVFALAFKGFFEMPKFFEVVGLRFNLYGLILAMAFITVYQLFQKSLTSLETKILIPALPFILIAIVIGARLWHVVTDFELYRSNLPAVLYIWNGGLSIFGALSGLFLVIVLFNKINAEKFNTTVVLEKLVLCIPLGQFIGRLGNFVNYELFGPPTLLPWGMFVPPAYRPHRFVAFEFFHPAFLYEMLGTGILFVLMSYLYKKRGIKGDGFFLYFYLAGYGMIRFIVDFFRLDPDVAGILSFGQTVCLVMIGIAVIVFLTQRLRGKQRH